MGSFVVSALKYRPDTFKSVVGQDALTTTLKNAIKSNKLAHSYLFCGPRGVGKTTCARIFAKTINCEFRTEEGEACNACESCVSFNEQRSYSIHELDAASNNGVDDIRSLTEQVRIPPQVGRYSVYIIDEVHMLSQGAFNAFLKTLEEPPAHAIFILATTEKHKIIPTILSRCQIYDFNRITISDTVNHLKYVAGEESVTIEESALNIIAQKSDGGMRDALSMFDQMVSFSGDTITYRDVIENLNVLDYDYYHRLVHAFLEGNSAESLLIFNEVLNKGFDAHHFITGLSEYLRDLLVSHDPVTIQLLEVGAELSVKYQEQAALCSPSFIFEALKISNECDLNYRISKNKRLLVEIALIRIAQLNSDKKKEYSSDNKPALKPVVPTTDSVTATQQQQATTEKIKETQPEQAPATAAKQVQRDSDSKPAPTHQTHHRTAPKPLSISISAPQKTSSADNDTVASIDKGEESQASEQAKSVTQENLTAAWKRYIQTLDGDPSTSAFLENRNPVLRDDHIVEVVVDNQFQEKELQQIGVMHFLRNDLENRKLTLKIEFAPEEEIKRNSTPQEIFRSMVKENPALEELRKNLSLEID